MCYYFGLAISRNEQISGANIAGTEYLVRKASDNASENTLTLFDLTCSNCRLCESERNFVL